MEDVREVKSVIVFRDKVLFSSITVEDCVIYVFDTLLETISAVFYSLPTSKYGMSKSSFDAMLRR